MAIKIQRLEQAAKLYTQQQYVYKDLSLDINFTQNKAPGFNNPTPNNDIRADFDTAAIKNSLLNLFNTLPGQRFLFPKYGLNLQQFLFEPVTINNADLIGNIILNGIKTYEPRVTPQQIQVTADPENSQYLVTIIINIPTFNTNTTTDFVFDLKGQTFYSVETSKLNN